MMLTDPPVPVTVEELLPAIVELASIQHDLIARLQGIVLGEKPPLQPMPPQRGRPRDGELATMAGRSHELLTWLLDRAKAKAGAGR